MNLEKGGLKKNFVHIFSSKAMVIILSFAVTPILSRVYSPLEYGVFGVFNTITLNFSILSSLGYGDGMGVSSNDRDFYALHKLSVILTIITAIVLLPFLPFLIKVLDRESAVQYGDVVILIWFGALFLSISNIVLKMNMHFNDFGFGSKVGVVSNVWMRIIALIGGFYPSKMPFGLILAELGHKVALLSAGFIRHNNRLKKAWLTTSRKDMLKVAKLYIAYPKYFLPSRYLSLLVAQVPIFYIARFYSLNDLGQYTMAASLVVLPINLFGNSLSAVYLRRFRGSGNVEIGSLTVKLFSFLLVALTIPVLLLLFLGPKLVWFFLGASWESTGILVQVMSIYLIYQTFFVAISGLFQVLKLESAFLKFQMISAIFVILFGVGSFIFDLNLWKFILGFSVLKLFLLSGVIHYLFIKIHVKYSVFIWLISVLLTILVFVGIH
ncbi:MAG: oligosaccharide flippase family protein [Cyclobacteriaceae bacterium]